MITVQALKLDAVLSTANSSQARLGYIGLPSRHLDDIPKGKLNFYEVTEDEDARRGEVLRLIFLFNLESKK